MKLLKISLSATLMVVAALCVNLSMEKSDNSLDLSSLMQNANAWKKCTDYFQTEGAGSQYVWQDWTEQWADQNGNIDVTHLGRTSSERTDNMDYLGSSTGMANRWAFCIIGGSKQCNTNSQTGMGKSVIVISQDELLGGSLFYDGYMN